MRSPISLSCLALFHWATIFASAAGSAGIDVRDTRLLNDPAISKRNIAFVYAGDLWIANLDGTSVRRLTSDVGLESHPAFSPDGSLVAFSAQYEGNTDVYVVSVEGGVPKRLTWHPGPDLVQGFTPDGTAILFTSDRVAYNNRYTQLFKVPAGGGMEELLEIPHAYRAAYSEDGKRIAYNPLSPRYQQWKGYRGGTVSRISIYSTSDHSVEKVPQPEGRCNDAEPMWLGNSVYFLSDREGEFNLFSFDAQTKVIRQHTRHTDFPVLNASSGGGKIIYEQAGYLHLFDPNTGSSSRLKIGVADDLAMARPRFVKGAKYIRNASLSPSGVRVALEFRGEIVTVPADKGDARNLTNSVGVHERSPVWSPDGKQIAYFSDESGEYELHVRDQSGKEPPKKLKLSGAGYYDRPAWAPDSQKIAYADNAWSVFWTDLRSGKTKKIATEKLYGPQKTIRPVWSPDSKWVAYTLSTASYIQTVYVYSVDQDKSFPISDGMSDATEPVFDRGGKYLYFLASTDAGPVRNWFALSNQDLRVTRSIYLVVLPKNLASPLVKESDEEKAQEERKERDESEDKNKVPPLGSVVMDLERIQDRVLALPVPAAEISNLHVGQAGHVYYLKNVDGKTSLERFDLKERKSKNILPEVNQTYEISADTRHLLYRLKDAWTVIPVDKKPEVASVPKPDDPDKDKGKLKVEAIEVLVDPRAEWQQMFNEAWRINRDYFYAPNMHGVDWKAAREKYSAFLPHLAARGDLNRVIQWMCSELSVGHHRVSGGDDFAQPHAVPGGLLGADYRIENGRYRFKKVYGGLNWNPDLRSPLLEPGVNVRAGEYLIAVAGQQLRPPKNVYSLFENTADKLIDITVGPNPDGSGSRTVAVVPIADEHALRNRDWVEGNLKKVTAATEGRVAYVYVPNTAAEGYKYFKRYFYPQAYKEAVIVDERFNAGGSLADYYLDILGRPLIAYWAMRYGDDMKTPSASIQGPKAMIIDETAGSGGDLLPWMFHKFKMGTLIGQRTWGGLVGVLGFPVLMDGGTVTAPNLAIWTTDQGWVVENEGMPPDIEVEQTPADVIAGRDPQLEKAIQVVMAELKKNPVPAPKRPPYPVKVRKPAPPKLSATESGSPAQ